MEYNFDICDSVFTEAKLSDSVIYQTFNTNSEMTSTVLSAIKDSIIIDSSFIEEQLIQIRRTKISPLVENVIKAFENGEIVLLHAKSKKIPQVLPFFVAKIQGKVKVFIFINNYGTITKSEKDSSEKYLNMSAKDLYVLMEGAYVNYNITVYPGRVTKSLGLMKVSNIIYTNMILRILNKEYALGMDKEAYAKVTFCISKFFLKNIWGAMNDDIAFNYAKGTLQGSVNIQEIMLVSRMYDSANITDIRGLLEFLKELTPRLAELNFRYFTQCYINMYKPGALFGMECLPYFLYTIECTLIGSFLVNQPIISDITKSIKLTNSFYPELTKVLI